VCESEIENENEWLDVKCFGFGFGFGFGDLWNPESSHLLSPAISGEGKRKLVLIPK
jgi:hypothetical protein